MNIGYRTNIGEFKKSLSASDKKFRLAFQMTVPDSQQDKDKLINSVQNRLNRINYLSEIVNTTLNEKEFFLSLNELNRILYDLTSYENIIEFSELPSERLKITYNNRVKYIDKLYERIRSYYAKEFDHMEGHDFEYFCASLLEKTGYTKVEVTKGSGDNGIDVLADKEGIRYGIQCKCYSSDIGVKAVQEAYSGASYYNCHVPVVLTNRFFTRQAKDLAEKIKVLLWDRVVLESLVQACIGVA